MTRKLTYFGHFRLKTENNNFLNQTKLHFISMNLLEKLDFFLGELLDFLHVGDDDSIYDLARKILLLLNEQEARELLRKHWREQKKNSNSFRASFSKKTRSLDNLRRCKSMWQDKNSAGLSALYERDNRFIN